MRKILYNALDQCAERCGIRDVTCSMIYQPLREGYNEMWNALGGWNVLDGDEKTEVRGVVGRARFVRVRSAAEDAEE